MSEVEAAIRDVRQYPQIGASISQRVRQRILAGFKYSVLYVDTPTEIVIVAIAPHKRRPDYWRKRLRQLHR